MCTVPGALALESAKPAPEKASAPVVSRLFATYYVTPLLHLVSSDGKIAPFALPEGTVWGSGGEGGSNDPVLSPDGKFVAYINKGNLIIRPVDAVKGEQVDGGYTDEEFLISGWSPDGKALVYFLGPPQGEDPAPSKITEPKRLVYDVKEGKSRELKIEGQLTGWLPGGEMLLYRDTGEEVVLSALSLEPGAEAMVLYRDKSAIGQVVLSPDGKSVACGISPRNETTTNQLISIELASGKKTPLSKPGEWAEFQWPKWSPDGKHVSWEARVDMKEGIPLTVVIVDGKPLTKPAQGLGHEWLTNNVVALVDEQALSVVDVTTGKELGRRPFKAAKQKKP